MGTLRILGPGRIACPFGEATVVLHLPETGWHELPGGGLANETPGHYVALGALSDGRFGLMVRLLPDPAHHGATLSLTEAFGLCAGPAQSWVRRKALEAALAQRDEAERCLRRGRAIAEELRGLGPLAVGPRPFGRRAHA